MVNARWREQYEDAVSTHFRAQEVAGLDICTDGDAHYDEEIGGWTWQSYPLTHMAGFSREVAPARSEGIAAHRRPLAGLEADRQTAVALSEQKAEEAKLIKPGRKDFTRCWHCSAKLLPVAFIGKGQRACR
jgi:methionine synthase II (cobalamin-independent)